MSLVPIKKKMLFRLYASPCKFRACIKKFLSSNAMPIACQRPLFTRFSWCHDSLHKPARRLVACLSWSDARKRESQEPVRACVRAFASLTARCCDLCWSAAVRRPQEPARRYLQQGRRQRSFVEWLWVCASCCCCGLARSSPRCSSWVPIKMTHLWRAGRAGQGSGPARLSFFLPFFNRCCLFFLIFFIRL